MTYHFRTDWTAVNSHGMFTLNTPSLCFPLVAYNGLFIFVLVLANRALQPGNGCLSHEKVEIYWAFDSSCFLADSRHLNFQVLPNYISTAAWHIDHECLLLAILQNPAPSAPLSEDPRATAWHSTPERMPLFQIFILLLQWKKMPLFKLERVKVFSYNPKVLDMLHLLSRAQDS